MSNTAAAMKMTNSGFFTEDLATHDPELFSAVEKELERQQTQIELIASENIVSRAVLQLSLIHI